ncbi:hypothetical protein TPHA_0G00570 [Tetrapisispora phaffii CBS 4417]|uniref:Serine hydrolase domain-containing protein n=1 Tax=Tetrapisispora phaffii (strain ATCC 24235 / CBS 4417 / NBRC 1672 / NRRL Y-8282 / UCD 70-5) TaxID=1071381 RepID=G8BVG5_TETPH|nr:hypothetical protein TPHA_0G00570 [Tetrapisispora phaffii CBS 4417]CCE63893.1 hypothetical protein TPHA_0G00570 [Tetrapisispora phaffii CBS 4417]
MSKKILMLHGLGQSGEYFCSKTKGFRQALENEGYELVYATAPNCYTPADMPDEYSEVLEGHDDDRVHAWIEDDKNNNTYKLPQSTFDYLHDLVIQEGPFIGVVGFSQGAGVAGYLATNFNELLNLTDEQQPLLKFIMLFSGFRLLPQQYQAQYDNNLITIPTLHVQGTLDTITEFSRVEELYNSCDMQKRTFLKHGGGHYIPNSKGFLKKVTEWLNELT